MNVRYGIVDEDAKFEGTYEDILNKYNGVTILDMKVKDYCDGEEILEVYRAVNEARGKSKRKTGQLLVEGAGKLILEPCNKTTLSLDSIEEDMQMFSEVAMKDLGILNYPTANRRKNKV